MVLMPGLTRGCVGDGDGGGGVMAPALARMEVATGDAAAAVNIEFPEFFLVWEEGVL